MTTQIEMAECSLCEGSGKRMTGPKYDRHEITCGCCKGSGQITAAERQRLEMVERQCKQISAVRKAQRNWWE